VLDRHGRKGDIVFVVCVCDLFLFEQLAESVRAILKVFHTTNHKGQP